MFSILTSNIVYTLNINFVDVDCGQLYNIENGTITLEDNRTTFKATARYTCNQNYSLTNGDAKRTCAEDGKWTGRTPQCLCKSILI